MSLLSMTWIPVIRQDGNHCRIAPWQIAETDNPVVELCAPRLDFQGGLYQFLIGLLQSRFAPEDGEAWFELYENPPVPEELKAAFDEATAAFELYNDLGLPAFLQDLALEDGEEKAIAGLLIEAPGGKTLKDNLDFFIKGGQVNRLCPSCTTQALFTLQTNAPSGGVGHRVGLRGGGPLTTLVCPVAADSTLWQKLWLNVLSRDEDDRLHEPVEPLSNDVFPWMGPTRLSDKSGRATFPEDVHPLQQYWGMPRRIRLLPSSGEGVCDLCGETCSDCYSGYRTRNYGTNYEGAWLHPLTPYRRDLKNQAPPLSLKGQKGGLSWRNWLGLALKDSGNGDQAAKVVEHFYAIKERFVDHRAEVRLWCFGYDMDNMKARCWYEHQLPLFHLSLEQIDGLQSCAQELLTAARDLAPLLRGQIKAAWYRRPKDVGGDISFIDSEFWSATEEPFYRLLSELAALPADIGPAPSDVYARWHRTLLRTAEQLFDRFSLDTSVEALDLKRVMQARAGLFEKFHSLKSIKTLKEKGAVAKEVVNG